MPPCFSTACTDTVFVGVEVSPHQLSNTIRSSLSCPREAGTRVLQGSTPSVGSGVNEPSAYSNPATSASR